MKNPFECAGGLRWMGRPGILKYPTPWRGPECSTGVLERAIVPENSLAWVTPEGKAGRTRTGRMTRATTGRVASSQNTLAETCDWTDTWNSE
jgi:hypothetical protein